jgi:hypothetical protein
MGKWGGGLKYWKDATIACHPAQRDLRAKPLAHIPENQYFESKSHIREMTLRGNANTR